MTKARLLFKIRHPHWNGAWCDPCDVPIYLVQAPSGATFYVDHSGKKHDH